MRYILYGAGAVGGTIGARLFANGRDVVLIARGDHGRAIAADGLRFGTPDGWQTLKIPVVEHPSRLRFRPDDVVIVSVKSQDTTGVLATLAPLAGDVAIVCAQNGVANERRALRRFANVHAMVVMMASVHLRPGVVHVHGWPFSGTCDVGRYPAGSDALDATLAADLEASSIHSAVHEDIMPRKYAKLVSNLTNVLEAAGGRAVLTSALAEDARREAVAVFAAAGIVVAASAGPSPVNALAAVDGVERPGGSTFQSLARGASTLETDDINGEIVLLGRLHGVPTPVNARLQRLALRLVTERVPAGSLTLAEI